VLRPRVLIVDDDPMARDAAASALREGGFDTTEGGDPAAIMRDLASVDRYDLVVLDVMMPVVSGFDICRAVRTVSGVPIILLTARTGSVDVVTGLELGADDYVTKPFTPSELVARARATVRRGPERGDPKPPAAFGLRDLEVDEVAFRARRGDQDLPLTTIELRLLIELTRHVDQVLTRDVLLERVWGYDYLGDSRLVDMAVKRLRAKLGEPPGPPAYITTVRGVGYRFERG
jgi:two-component system response regulator MtrA